MKFKLSDVASIAEIIGAFAVVISLIYVGVQVNDSVGAVRSASANDANVAVQSWYQEIGSDQQTSELFYNALTSEEPLSNQEEFEAEKLTRHIARIMLGLPPITREPVGVSKCAIEKLTGTYVWDGFPMDVLEGDDGLIIRDSEEIKLKATSDSTFFIEDDEEVEVCFKDEQACKFNRMILYNRLTTPRTAIRDLRASSGETPS